MKVSSGQRLLAINTGSSSLKVALYRMGTTELLIVSVEVDRIGHDGGRMRIRDAAGATWHEGPAAAHDHSEALQATLSWLRQHGLHQPIHAAGHRLVHGGARHIHPEHINAGLLASLDEQAVLAPDHLPQALEAIRFMALHDPAMPQVACFDTAFHHHMPDIAKMYALPRQFFDEGLRRFGFHGLSYEFIAQELRALDGEQAGGRTVVAHLGSGASMAALRSGKSIDTSMGMTPASGLVMSSRAGDIDAEAVLQLLRQGMAPSAVEDLLNRRSGLLGASGSTGDMQQLLDMRAHDPHAHDAVALFCYRARKYLGAYAAALGGLDTVVFTGGMGAFSADIREQICGGLDFLGIDLDPERNRAHAAVISQQRAPVTVRVIKTNEELMIARHTAEVLA